MSQRSNHSTCFTTSKTDILILFIQFSVGYIILESKKVISSVVLVQTTESLLKINPWYQLVFNEFVNFDANDIRVRSYLPSIFA